MHKVTRTVISAGVLAAMLLPLASAQAQFGGILRRAREATNAAAGSDGCDSGSSSDAGSRMLGSLARGAANDAAYSTGISSWVPSAEFADQLDASIACKLDPQEQAKAAEATLQATRGVDGDETSRPQVGQMAAWTSETREDVSGTSTVSAVERPGRGGRDCIMVTDIIIVSGEETRAEKRMCRVPPAVRYAIEA